MAQSRYRTTQPVLVFDLELLKAMADETRSRILRLLCTPEQGYMRAHSVTELAMNFNLTASTVSHHLQLLRRADLVTVERRGKERYYALNFESLRRRVGQFYDLLTSIEEATAQAARARI
jgi:ArsR family transcriptional regulator, arsenate/arsenite/antimonite-responsive transcriptional repressor